MEKGQENTEVKLNKEHPAPTEEVQLTIETVTPDTHQSLPKAPADNKKIEERDELANDSQKEHDEIEEVKAESKEPEEDTPQAKNEQEDEAENTEDTASEKGTANTDEDDERDKIETIAP